MRISITLLSLLFILGLKAQSVTEINFIDNQWYFELQNRSSIKIESLKLCNGTDTAIIAKPIIDSLNTNKITVISSADLSDSLYFNISDDYGFLIVNDTIIDHFEWYSDFKEEEYSWVYLDSIELKKYGLLSNLSNNSDCEDNDYYAGIGLSSLGKENHIEDCFSYLEGRLYVDSYYYQGSLNEIQFTAQGLLNSEFGDTITTDKDGYFSAIALAWNYRNSFLNIYVNKCRTYSIDFVKDNGAECEMVFNIINDTTGLGLFSIAWDINGFKPGNNTIVFYGIGVGIDELKKNSKLKISPTVASDRITASYSVDGADYKLCKLTLTSATGQQILSVPLQSREGEQVIDLPSGFAKGVYYCSLVCEGQAVKTEEIIIR